MDLLSLVCPSQHPCGSHFIPEAIFLAFLPLSPRLLAVMFPSTGLSAGPSLGLRQLCLSPHNPGVCSPLPSRLLLGQQSRPLTVHPDTFFVFLGAGGSAFSALLVFRALNTKVFVYLHASRLFARLNESSSRAGLEWAGSWLCPQRGEVCLGHHLDKCIWNERLPAAGLSTHGARVQRASLAPGTHMVP